MAFELHPHATSHLSCCKLLVLVLALACLPLHSMPLKIYVYDLPKWKNFTAIGDVRGSDYGLDQIFPEQLKASKYVTTDPEEADYFFADAWVFWPHALNPIQEIVAEIRRQGPWFDRNSGADHIFVITADQGRCQYYWEDTRLSIFLHHYGGNMHNANMFTNERILLDRWGGELDRELILAEAIRMENHCLIHNEQFNGRMQCTENAYQQRTPFFCHNSHQDIVVPPPSFEWRSKEDKHHSSFHIKNDLAFVTPWTDDRAAEIGKERTIMLFHAGSTHLHQAEFYSLGARQTFVNMFGSKHKPGTENFVLTPGSMSDDYWTSLLKSTFCLATTGTGWGSRFKVALAKGCIPLIVMDGVKSEFEEQLPLKEYAIRMPLYMAYRAPDILKLFVDSGRVKEMQENMKCAWRLHYWRQPWGKAFEVVMCTLKRRKLGLGGQIPVDFKACTMRCGSEVVQIMDEGSAPTG